jgi:hypothetical protein
VFKNFRAILFFFRLAPCHSIEFTVNIFFSTKMDIVYHDIRVTPAITLYPPRYGRLIQRHAENSDLKVISSHIYIHTHLLPFVPT